MSLLLPLLALTDGGGAKLQSPKQRRMAKEFDEFLALEKHIPDLVEEYVAREEAKLAQLKALAAETMERPRDFLYNPVNVFRLINRLTNSRLLELMRNNSAQDILDPVDPPGEENLAKAARELFLWQDKRGHSPAEIAAGAAATAQPLSAGDAFRLGKTAFEDGDYRHAAVWLEQSLSQMDSATPKQEQFQSLDYLSHSYFNLGANLQRVYWLIKHHPDNTQAKENLEYMTDLLQQGGLLLPASEGDLPPVNYEKVSQETSNA